MKRFFYIITLVLLLCSCEESGVQMGSVKYYPSFLWVDACTVSIENTYHFDFSPDAKNDEFCFAEFQFVDNTGNPIDTNTMRVMSGNEWLVDNKLKVTNDVDSILLKFFFTPQAEGGQYQGYFRLVNYNLDRLDSQPLDGTQPVDAFQWTLQYEKCMNPLVKVLMWTGITLVTFLFLWLMFLRPVLYPRIRLSRIELSSKKGYYTNKKINGTIKVVVTNKYKPQSWLSKMFCGKVLFIKDDIWTSTWEITPKGRKKAAKISLHGNYMIIPVTSELSNYGVYQLNNMTTKETITIKIL